MTARKCWRTGISSVVIAGSALAMAGCGSSSASGQTVDLITPDQAQAVATAFTQTPTTSALVKHEVGALRAITQASLTTSPPPSPEPTQDPSITHSVTVWVAHQSSYPLSFACFDAPTIPNGRAIPQFFFFSKANKSAPWTASYSMLSLGMGGAPDVALDKNGYAQVVPRDRYGAFVASPAQLGNDYAAYLTAGKSADTHEFAPGPQTSESVDGNNKTIRAAQQSKSTTVTFSFAPSGDPVVAYLLNDGSALVLLGIQATIHQVATKDPLVVTQDGKGISGPPPGKYRDLTENALFMEAFMDPAKGSADKITGLGQDAGVVRGTGTPA